MKIQLRFRKGFRAFNVMELMIVLAVLALLLIIFSHSFAGKNRKSTRINCVSNLKNVGLAFCVFQSDHDDKLPFHLQASAGGSLDWANFPEAFRHFMVLSNGLNSPKPLVCPTDDRKPAETFPAIRDKNLSYFLALPNEPVNPEGWLAGDRNLRLDGIAAQPGFARLTPATEVGWTEKIHKDNGNILLRDGSVYQIGSALLNQSLEKNGEKLRLVIP